MEALLESVCLKNRAGRKDCNDCDRQSNPGAFDVPASKVDEDCNGTVDDEPADCGKGLPVDGDPIAAAKALGICRMATPDAQGKDRTWGLLRAAYVFPDGTTAALKPEIDRCGKGGEPPYPRSHGILPGFGNNVKPREGANFVALSSGIARSGRQGTEMLTWPESALTCTSSKLPPGFPPSSYSTCGDLERNYPDTTPGNFGATGWLRTRSNIVPGEDITIRFAIWDGADEALDSTVLIDNFAWSATPGATVTDRPPPVQ